MNKEQSTRRIMLNLRTLSKYTATPGNGCTRLPFTEDQVQTEAKRCLGCGATKVDENACIGCGLCRNTCPNDAISEGKIITIYMRDIDIENTRKLSDIDNIQIFENPEDILDKI